MPFDIEEKNLYLYPGRWLDGKGINTNADSIVDLVERGGHALANHTRFGGSLVLPDWDRGETCRPMETRPSSNLRNLAAWELLKKFAFQHLA